MTTRVSRHQKGQTNLVLMKQQMMGWQCRQLDHMQIICTLLQTDNYVSTSPLITLPDAKPAVSKQ